MRKFVLIALLTLAAFPVHAQMQTDEAIAKDAIENTKILMTDRSLRDQALKTSLDAQKANDSVERLTGSKQNTDEVYSIAADMIDPLMQQVGNDPRKMEEILLKAQSNPEEFAATLSAAQKERIKNVADKIGSGRGPATSLKP